MPLVRSVPPWVVIRAMTPTPKPPILVGAEYGASGAVVHTSDPVMIPDAEWSRYYERAVAAGHLELVGPQTDPTPSVGGG